MGRGSRKYGLGIDFERRKKDKCLKKNKFYLLSKSYFSPKSND